MRPYLASIRRLLRLGAMLLCTTLAACVAAPPASLPPIFNDHDFAPAAAIDAAQVFALDDAMRQYVRTEVGRATRNKNPRAALYDALYDKNQLKLEYDAAMTRNARETCRPVAAAGLRDNSLIFRLGPGMGSSSAEEELSDS